jgi:uncharacterized integral membrane protein (TIGR00698 family)
MNFDYTGSAPGEAASPRIAEFPESVSYYDSISGDALASLDCMEGVYSLPVVEARPIAAAKTVAKDSVWLGYGLVGLTAASAYAIHYLPIRPFQVASESGVRRPVSAAIIAILIGVLLRNLLPLPGTIVKCCKIVVKRTIPATIVLTGAGLNLALLATIGARAMSITVISIGIAMASAYGLGRVLGVWPKTAALIGVGTAICGNSAIVAVAPLIEAGEEDVALSVGTINIIGLLFMFLLPFAGRLLALTDNEFGVWVGSTIHAVPQVVAAAFAYSQRAGTLGTLVKLVRVTLLAPFMIAMVMIYARRRQTKITLHYSRLVPSFVWGFLVLALLNTTNLLPTLQFHAVPWVAGPAGKFTLPATSALSELENLLLTLAMAAMGLEVSVRRLANVGGAAVLTGLGASVIVSLAGLMLIRILL